MTAEEFETKRKQTTGKFINDPGTYSLVVTGVDIKGANQKDAQWADVVFTLENPEGQSYNHYVSLPLTAARSFLFGPKKTLYAYNDLDKFLRGFGVVLEYSNAITQLQDLFSDPAITFVGKPISMRLGYQSNRSKYVGKSDTGSQYILVDKDDKQIGTEVFSGFEAAEAFADEQKIKLQKFIRCLDVIAAKEVQLSSVRAVGADLPF